MGLIDDIRKERDSWMVRFEEHRREECGDHEQTDGTAESEEEIERNRRMVGVFPKRKGTK